MEKVWHDVQQEIGVQAGKRVPSVSETTGSPVGGWNTAKGSLGLGPL